MNTGGGRSRYLGILGNYRQYFIDPNMRWYRIWKVFMLLLYLFSTWITPVEFAFSEVLPATLVHLEWSQICFFIDVILQLLVTYIFDSLYEISRYIDSFWLDIIACVPWILIYHLFGDNKVVRWFVLLRMYRLRKVFELCSTKSLKMLALYLTAFHVGGCFNFYSAIIVPPGEDANTWIGSLTVGIHSYSTFRHMAFWKLYNLSIYYAYATVTTLGFGDIHPVNDIERYITGILVVSMLVLTVHICDDTRKKKHNRDEKGNPDFDVCGQEYQFRQLGPPPIINKGSKKKKRKAKGNVKKVPQFDDMLKLQHLTYGKTNMNGKDSFGKTPLHVAASEGKVDMARMLIESGAEVDAIDDIGNTPLLEAIKGKHAEMVCLLQKKGAKLMTGEANAYLCSIIESDDVEHVKWLLEIGMNPNARDKNNNTSLHIIVKKCSLAMMQLLLNQRADKEQDRRTSRDDGVLSDIVDQVISHKSSTNDMDDEEPGRFKIVYDLYKEGDEKALSFSYNLGFGTICYIGIEFWKKIYCDNNDTSEIERGWLDDDHIDMWGHMLLKTEQQGVRCTIMPTHFMSSHSFEGLVTTWIALARGSYPPYKAWGHVDLVLLPINHDNGHWLIACLELKTWTFTVYDSYPLEIRETWMEEKMAAFDINGFLESIAYWETSGRERTRVNLIVQFATDMPQQTNNRDCGVLVCMWLEAFSSGKVLKLERGKTEERCLMYRRTMADAIWAQHASCLN